MKLNHIAVACLTLFIAGCRTSGSNAEITNLIRELETADPALVMPTKGPCQVESTEVEARLLRFGPAILPQLLASLKRQDFKSRYVGVAYARIIASLGEAALPFLVQALESYPIHPPIDKKHEDEYFYITHLIGGLRVTSHPDEELKNLVRRLSVDAAGRTNLNALDTLNFWEQRKPNKISEGTR